MKNQQQTTSPNVFANGLNLLLGSLQQKVDQGPGDMVT